MFENLLHAQVEMVRKRQLSGSRERAQKSALVFHCLSYGTIMRTQAAKGSQHALIEK